MLSFVSNTLLGTTPPSEPGQPPRGVSQIIALVRMSIPSVGAQLAPKNTQIKNTRRAAFAAGASVTDAFTFVDELCSEIRNSAATIVDVYGASGTKMRHMCKYTVGASSSEYTADSLAKELAISVWNYAALTFLSATDRFPFDQELLLDAADLFEWHSLLAEKAGFCERTAPMIPAFASARMGKTMNLLSLAIYAHKRAFAEHEKYCNKKEISEFAYWFMYAAKLACEVACIEDWREPCEMIYAHGVKWNSFFFWADHCMTQVHTEKSIDQPLLAMHKLTAIMETEKLPDAALFRKTLENTRTVCKRDSWMSWSNWNLLGTAIQVSEETLPKQPPPSQKNLDRRDPRVGALLFVNKQ